MNVKVSFLVVCIISFTSSETIDPVTKSCNEKTECCSDSCHRAAKVLTFNINASVKPCHNFYKFACGGYVEKTELHGSMYRDYYTDLDAKIKTILFNIVSKPILTKDHLPVKLVKQIYSLCLNEDKIDNNSIPVLMKILESLGGFPFMPGTWNVTSFSLHKFLLQLRSVGFIQNTFFSITVAGSEKDGYQFQLGKPDFSNRRDMLAKGRNSSEVENYFQYMNATIVALGGNASEIRDQLEAVLNFEIELAKTANLDNQIGNDEEEESPLSYNGTSNSTALNASSTQQEYEDDSSSSTELKNMNKEYPGFQWVEFFNDSYSPFLNLTFNESVAIEYPLYYQGFSNLTFHTNNRTLYNFLLWRFIDELVKFLPRRIQKIKEKFLKYDEDEKPRTRNESCLEFIQDNFDAEIGYMYIMNYNKTHEKSVRRIAESIREIYIETFKNSTWMKNSTREEAVKKVKEMAFHISYPATLDNASFVDEYYSGLTLQNDSFLVSFLQLAVFGEKKQMKSRFEDDKVDIRFLKQIADAQPAYDTEDNALLIPASVMMEIFYAYNRTDYLNFGAIGSVIGRQIAQGFNNEGRIHNAKGLETNWWDNVTETIYRNRSQCFVHQYSNMSNKTINGERTLNENIADNVGVTEVYLAYKKIAQRYEQEKKLPGLPYSPSQLFWLEYAATMCMKMDEYYANYMIPGLLSSPPEYRVNIVVGNIDNFRKDWNCSSETMMAFNHTCKLW